MSKENEQDPEVVETAPEQKEPEVKAVKKSVAKKTPTKREVKEKAIVDSILAEDELTEAEVAIIDAEEANVAKKLNTPEEVIENLRQVVNNLVKLDNKVVDRTSGRGNKVLADKINGIWSKLRHLMAEYGNKNRADGFKVLIERKGVAILGEQNNKGHMVVDCGTSKPVAYALCDEIKTKLERLEKEKIDSLLTVVSCESEKTFIASILVSTISGFSAKYYDSCSHYVPKNRLEPLDTLMPSVPLTGGPFGDNTDLIN